MVTGKNIREESKDGDSFPSSLPTPKHTHHTNPSKSSPGSFCSRLLSECRLSLFWNKLGAELLPVLSFMPAPSAHTAQHRGTRQDRDHLLPPAHSKPHREYVQLQTSSEAQPEWEGGAS